VHFRPKVPFKGKACAISCLQLCSQDPAGMSAKELLGPIHVHAAADIFINTRTNSGISQKERNTPRHRYQSNNSIQKSIPPPQLASTPTQPAQVNHGHDGHYKVNDGLIIFSLLPKDDHLLVGLQTQLAPCHLRRDQLTNEDKASTSRPYARRTSYNVNGGP
jgi:hypothetical protein